VTSYELDRLLIETKAGRARGSHLEFMRTMWRGMSTFTPGFHTVKICARIDKAIQDYRDGKSTYLLINVHPRAGKSDIISRYLGPHFLGEFPRTEVMQVSYAAEKAVEFSAFTRNIFDMPLFKIAYPNLKISADTNRKDHYLTQEGGGLMATGLQGHMTGSGYVLGILDDYCSGRAEAESRVQRESAWNAFTNDFLTRSAPVHIIIVLATQWHDDDITGRIKKAMLSEPDFPRFESMQFPAKAIDYKGEGNYPNEYLFEERYGKEWYRGQYATLGKYSASALMDCNPMLRTGGRISIENIEWIEEIPKGKSLSIVRIWDLAHTAKQRGGDDPDWTSGTKLAFERVPGEPVPFLWVFDVMRTRDDAPARDAKIRTISRMDGTQVRQAVESSLDAKDAYPYLRDSMPEISWQRIDLGKGDKATRAVPLEAIFEAKSHVKVMHGAWNDAWIDEILRFDGLGKEHDDQVDNLSAGYHMQMGAGKVSVPSGNVRALAGF
jgi:phage terminase large subunit-like protein